MTAHPCPACDDTAIRNVIGRAALFGDQHDLENYRKLFVPDATWHLGDVTRTGADEITAGTGAFASGPGAGGRHLVTPLQVEVDGVTARTVSYWAFLMGTAIEASGTYHDQLTRTEAGWRITRRTLTVG